MSPPRQNNTSTLHARAAKPRQQKCACGQTTSTEMGGRLRARRWIHSLVMRDKRVSVRRQADKQTSCLGGMGGRGSRKLARAFAANSCPTT
ncbi:unnamed protein product [Ectocarpus sp. 12 AP-2014]